MVCFHTELCESHINCCKRKIGEIKKIIFLSEMKNHFLKSTWRTGPLYRWPWWWVSAFSVNWYSILGGLPAVSLLRLIGNDFDSLFSFIGWEYCVFICGVFALGMVIFFRHHSMYSQQGLFFPCYYPSKFMALLMGGEQIFDLLFI